MAQTIHDGLHNLGAISFGIQLWIPRGELLQTCM